MAPWAICRRSLPAQYIRQMMPGPSVGCMSCQMVLPGQRSSAAPSHASLPCLCPMRVVQWGSPTLVVPPVTARGAAPALLSFGGRGWRAMRSLARAGQQQVPAAAAAGGADARMLGLAGMQWCSAAAAGPTCSGRHPARHPAARAPRPPKTSRSARSGVTPVACQQRDGWRAAPSEVTRPPKPASLS